MQGRYASGTFCHLGLIHRPDSQTNTNLPYTGDGFEHLKKQRSLKKSQLAVCKKLVSLQELTTPRFGKVCHIPMHPSFCNETAACFYEAGKELGLSISPKGTAITIEGPRFSSRAESKLFQSWGADVINMTTVPEVVLAKELGMSYARYFMSCT